MDTYVHVCVPILMRKYVFFNLKKKIKMIATLIL